MGKTFDQSLIDTATISMSMIDPEDMMDTSSEEFLSLRRIQQGCHSELCNRTDFPCKKADKVIKTDKMRTGEGHRPSYLFKYNNEKNK